MFTFLFWEKKPILLKCHQSTKKKSLLGDPPFTVPGVSKKREYFVLLACGNHGVPGHEFSPYEKNCATLLDTKILATFCLSNKRH